MKSQALSQTRLGRDENEPDTFSSYEAPPTPRSGVGLDELLDRYPYSSRKLTEKSSGLSVREVGL
jgi:hypothetical protein